MPFTRVQASPKATATNTASVTITLSAPPAEGNGLIVLVNAWTQDQVKPTLCTDNHGNTYVLGHEALQQVAYAGIFYCALVHTSGAPLPFTITVATTGSLLKWQARAIEVGGLGIHGLVIEGGANGGGTTNDPSTGTMNPLTGTESFQAATHAIAHDQTSIAVVSATPPWNVEFEELSSAAQIAGEAVTRIVPNAAGTQPTVSWVDSSVLYVWAAVLVAFKTHPPLVNFYPIIAVPPSGPQVEGPYWESFVYGPWDEKNRRSFVLSPNKFADRTPFSDQYVRSSDAHAAPWSQHFVNYVSPPLKAQTLGGMMDLVLGLRVSNADMLYRYRIVVWVSAPYLVEGDFYGLHFAFVARGNMSFNDEVGHYFPTVSTGCGLPGPIALPAIEVQEGDHLVVEIGVVADAPPGGGSRYAYIEMAAASDRPPGEHPNPDLVIGSLETTTRAGFIGFTQPPILVDPPPNDDYESATVIPAVPYEGQPVNVELATYDPTTDLPAGCVPNQDQGLYNTVWWTYTATFTTTLRVESNAQGDTTLVTYMLSGVTLIEVKCAVGYNGYDSMNLVSVSAGTTYYFRLGGRFHVDGSQYGLKVRSVTQPANDNFANATVITSLPFTDITDTTIATDEPGEPISPTDWTSAPKQSVWYKWVADATPGNIRVNTFGSDYDSQVTIWELVGPTPSFGALTEVFSSPWTNLREDPFYVDQANCVFRPTPGKTYYITVFSGGNAYWNNQGGSHLELTISRATPVPPNETRATALVVTSIPYYTNVDCSNAADGQMEVVPLGDCDWFTMGDNDSGKVLWWKWTADRAAAINFNTFGSGWDGPFTEVIFYREIGGILEALQCDTYNMRYEATQLFFTSEVGTTYYWRITSNGRIGGPVYFFLDLDYDTFQTGDVILSDGYMWIFAESGAARLVDGASRGIPTGSGIDPITKLLYVASWRDEYVMVFDPRLNELPGGFTTAPGLTPEIPGFFMNGDLYVGHWGNFANEGIDGLVDPTHAIRRINAATGTLMGVYLAKQEINGTAWLDPAIDQRTIHYTSRGRKVMAYDIVADLQLPDVVTLTDPWPTYRARAIRHRPNGELLIGDGAEVKRLSPTGSVLQRYPVDGREDMHVIDQDPTSATFWVGDQDTSLFYRVDVATGAVLLKVPGGHFGAPYMGPGYLCGLTVIGGYRAGVPPPPPPSLVRPLPPSGKIHYYGYAFHRPRLDAPDLVINPLAESDEPKPLGLAPGARLDLRVGGTIEAQLLGVKAESTQPLGNPFVADRDGYFSTYVIPDPLDHQFEGMDLTRYTLLDVVVLDPRVQDLENRIAAIILARQGT